MNERFVSSSYFFFSSYFLANDSFMCRKVSSPSSSSSRFLPISRAGNGWEWCVYRQGNAGKHEGIDRISPKITRMA